MTEKVQADKRDTQEQIDTRLSEVDRAIGDEKWAKFQREYYDLMIKKSIREAASHLAGWDSKDPGARASGSTSERMSYRSSRESPKRPRRTDSGQAHQGGGGR